MAKTVALHVVSLRTERAPYLGKVQVLLQVVLKRQLSGINLLACRARPNSSSTDHLTLFRSVSDFEFAEKTRKLLFRLL